MCKISRNFCQRHFLIRRLIYYVIVVSPHKKSIFFPNFSKKMSTGGKNLHLLKLMMADKSRNSFQNRCRLVKFAYPAMYNVHSRPQGRVLFKLFWHGYHR